MPIDVQPYLTGQEKNGIGMGSGGTCYSRTSYVSTVSAMRWRIPESGPYDAQQRMKTSCATPSPHFT